jgi:hypothetical protein
MRETTTAPPTGEAVRDHLIAALRADIVGPFAGADAHDAPEVLDLPPSRWYLAGFLAPEGDRVISDPTADDEDGAGDDRQAEDAGFEEPAPKQRKVFPASLGLSVLLPPGEGGHLVARVRWAEYTVDELEADPAEEGRKRKRKVWTRHPRGPVEQRVPLDPIKLAAGLPLDTADGLWLVGQLGRADGPGLAPGTRALSLFIVNRRSVPDPRRADESFIFQVSLELEAAAGFVPRPNRTGEAERRDFDERVADLQYRDHHEHVVGHNVSGEVDEAAPRVKNRPTRVRSRWLPCCEVRRVKPQDDPRIETRMDLLAALDGPESVQACLGLLTAAYGTWLSGQAEISLDSTEREQTRATLLRRAGIASGRIARGIALLAEDPEVRRAFTLANQPRWHLFQLAFLLHEPRRDRRPRRRGPRRRRADLLPDRRRQDRGLPRRHRLHPAAAPHARPATAPTPASASPCSCATRCACSPSTSSAAPRR